MLGRYNVVLEGIGANYGVIQYVPCDSRKEAKEWYDIKRRSPRYRSGWVISTMPEYSAQKLLDKYNKKTRR